MGCERPKGTLSRLTSVHTDEELGLNGQGRGLIPFKRVPYLRDLAVA